MKKIYCLLIGSFLMLGCMQDDIYKQAPNDQEHSVNALKGKSFVLNQIELQNKYSKNRNLYSILEEDFKGRTSLIKTSNDTPGQYGIDIDLDHIQVFESSQIHAITYNIINENQDNDPPQEIYNLVYFSRDYQNYYVTLLKYDFSQISFQDFINNPSLTLQVLKFFPLNDIDNIYENIDYSISHPTMGTFGMDSANPAFSFSFTNLSDCMQTVYVEGSLCKGKGDPKHKYGEECGMSGGSRATPGYSYLDFSGCGGTNPGGSSGGGGGSVGSPGPGGDGSAPPIKANPVKGVQDFKLIGSLLSQINIGNTDRNIKMLKTVSSLFMDDVKDLNNKLGQTKEYGYGYNLKKVNGLYNLINKYTLPNPIGVNSRVNMENVANYYYGIIHSHPENIGSINHKGTPLFSSTDIGSLFKFANKTTNKPEKEPSDAFIGAVNKYGLYMVMLPNDVNQGNIAAKYGDFVKVSTIGNTVSADYKKVKWEKIGEELILRYQKIESTEEENLKKQALEKALLEVLIEFQLDVNIYFLDKNGGYFNGAWQQLTLNNGKVNYTNLN